MKAGIKKPRTVEHVLDKAKADTRHPVEEIPECPCCGRACAEPFYWHGVPTCSMKCHFDYLQKQRLQEVKKLARG